MHATVRAPRHCTWPARTTTYRWAAALYFSCVRLTEWNSPKRSNPAHLINHVQVVTSLLECNAKLNKKDRYGNTPLIHTCLRGHVDTATILLQVNRTLTLLPPSGSNRPTPSHWGNKRLSVGLYSCQGPKSGKNDSRAIA